MAILLWSLTSAPAAWAGPASVAAYRAGTASIIAPATAIADFDADGHPDVAIADRDANYGGAGTEYLIELRLSAGTSQTIRFGSSHRALTVTAIDVDHDRDLDIVFTPLFSGHIVTVFLNDGAGHFDHGRIEASGPDLTASTSVAAAGAHAAGVMAAMTPRLPTLGTARSAALISTGVRPVSQPHSDAHLRTPPRSVRPRGPPSVIPL